MDVKEKGVSFNKSEVQRAKNLFVQAVAQGVVTNLTDDSVFLPYRYLSTLEVYQLNMLGMDAMPYRLKLQSNDRFGGTRFCIQYHFVDGSGRPISFDSIQGCLYCINNKKHILYKTKYELINLIDELNKIKSSLDERARVFEKIQCFLKQEASDSVIDQAILDIELYRINNFSLDKQPGPEYILTPNIKTEANCITPHIAEKFTQEFLKGSVGQGRKIHNCYLAYSKSIKLFFKFIKQANEKTITQRRDVFYNPQKYFKKELENKFDFIKLGEQQNNDQCKEDEIENIIEATFKESKKWKSNRIIELGQWIPKANCYIPDPQNQAEWIPKDIVSLPISDGEDTCFIHAKPTELSNLLEKVQAAQSQNKQQIEFEDQTIPVNPSTIETIKKTIDGLRDVAQQVSKASPPKDSTNNLSHLVPIIRDNIDKLIFSKQKQVEFKFSSDLNSIVTKSNSPVNDLLYDHQKKGVEWMQKNFLHRSPGVILADDMGLGKTLQTLVFLIWLKNIYTTYVNKIKQKPFLIVAPRALIKNWQDEHDHFFSQGLGTACQASGSSWHRNQTHENCIKNLQEAYNWTITTYETLRDKQEIFRQVGWGVIIFDEAQKIKNPNSLLTEMAKAMSSDFSIAITGTPIENNLIDLWCISDCVWPKKFDLLKEFTKKFCHADSDLSDLKKQALFDEPRFLIKRWKDDIGKTSPSKKLPPKIVQKYTHNIDGVQLQAYDTIISKLNQRIYKGPFDFLQELRRYMLFVDDNVNDVQLEQKNTRIKLMCQILEQIKRKNEKALIFLNSKKLQLRLVSFLKNRFSMEYDPFLINGDVSGVRRKALVDNFQRPRTPGFDVFLLGPKSGGVGFTMTAANHVIHLDRWWNPAVEDQCTDRVYRIGQTKQVQVHIPLATHPKLGDNSFDHQIDRLLENKRKLAYDIIAPPINKPTDSDKEQLYYKVGGQISPHNYTQDGFYKSDKWKNLRQLCLKRYGSICMNPQCRSQDRIEVDHVRPRSKYPHLEDDPNNLQVLCHTCNLKKSATVSAEWDFRPPD